MPRQTSTNKHVIFRFAEQYEGPNTYYGWDGSTTTNKDQAASFYSVDEAKEFAEQKGIDLTGAIPYIGLQTFKES